MKVKVKLSRGQGRLTGREIVLEYAVYTKY